MPDGNMTVNIGFSVGFLSLLALAFYVGKIDTRIAHIEKEVPAYDEMANRLIMVSTQLDGLLTSISEFKTEIRSELKELRHKVDGRGEK